MKNNILNVVFSAVATIGGAWCQQFKGLIDNLFNVKSKNYISVFVNLTVFLGLWLIFLTILAQYIYYYEYRYGTDVLLLMAYGYLEMFIYFTILALASLLALHIAVSWYDILEDYVRILALFIRWFLWY
jgi:hypothetical protein